MDAYERACETYREIKYGRVFTDSEKRTVTDKLLCEASFSDGIFFVDSANAPKTRGMYPLFFFPPYDGGSKRRTLMGFKPGTRILYANSYELEILYILALWRASDEKVAHMLSETRKRLESVCFGNYCSLGECFETSIVVLKYISAAFPDETAWIAHLSERIAADMEVKKRRPGVKAYFDEVMSGIQVRS